MAEIRAFNAIRPTKELANKIAALPYDVYNTEEAREIVSANSFSFLAIDRAEVNFPKGQDIYAPEVYRKASSILNEWVEEGKMIKEDKPCFYIYSQTMDGRTQTGIVGCFNIDEYLNGIVKKHENTRADKEQDRIRHVDVCNAQTGPIFLAYRPSQTIDDVTCRIRKETPLYDFSSGDGIRHSVWIIEKESDVKTIENAFKSISNIYIADGHHRCASAVKVGLKRREENPGYTGEEEFNYVLSVLFPQNQLAIMDYNRVVKDLNGYSADEFMKKISDNFSLEEKGNDAVRPGEKGQFGMFLEGKWYLLTAKQAILSDDPVEGLDVSILQNNLLEPVLGISNPKTDKRIDFVGGIRGLGELEKRVNEDCKVAFSMYPTSMDELFNVADAGKLMPPKSTWFEPKLLSGLFIHQL